MTWRLNDSFQVVWWCQSVFAGTVAVSVSPWALRIKKTKQNSILLSYGSGKHIDPSLLDEFLCCKQLCDHHPGQAPGHFQHPDDSFGFLPVGALHGSSLFWLIVGFYLIKDSQPLLTRAWLLYTTVSLMILPISLVPFYCQGLVHSSHIIIHFSFLLLMNSVIPVWGYGEWSCYACMHMFSSLLGKYLEAEEPGHSRDRRPTNNFPTLLCFTLNLQWMRVPWSLSQ